MSGVEEYLPLLPHGAPRANILAKAQKGVTSQLDLMSKKVEGWHSQCSVQIAAPVTKMMLAPVTFAYGSCMFCGANETLTLNSCLKKKKAGTASVQIAAPATKMMVALSTISRVKLVKMSPI